MWNGTDRRGSVRVKYPCLIKLCKSTEPLEGILTHTENISPKGARILIKEKIEVGSEIDLEIDLQDTLPNIIAKGTINRVKETFAGPTGETLRYVTGIKFTELKDKDRRRIQGVVDHLSRR